MLLTVILAWILQKHMHVFQKHWPSPAPEMTATLIVVLQQTTEHTSKLSCTTNSIKGHSLQKQAKHHLRRLPNQEVSAFSPCRFLWLNARSKRIKTHVKPTSIPWMMMFLLLSLVLFSSVWNSLLFCDSGDSSTICSKMPKRTSTLWLPPKNWNHKKTEEINLTLHSPKPTIYCRTLSPKSNIWPWPSHQTTQCFIW